MERKYPSDAYQGFRASLPDWLIGLPTAADQERAIRLLQLRPGDCVCDVACGSGYNLHKLVRAVKPDGLVIAVEDNPSLLARSEEKVRHSGWANVRLLNELDVDQFERRAVDGIIVSYNPPIFLQRHDLLRAAWQLLKQGGRMALVAGRCTTPVGRAVGPAVKLFLRLAGHGEDWRYWLVHEPWKYLGELSAGRLWVETRWGFQYLLWAEKGEGSVETA
jgi:SAM-dependent methyltransferase